MLKIFEMIDNLTILLKWFIELSILFLMLYLAFIKSYFKEKGKNIATKEDIEGITLLVEKIKTEFSKETEILKANLQLSNQIYFSIKAEEIKSLLSFYEKYSSWLNSILKIYTSKITPQNKELLSKYVINIEDIYNDFLLSESKLHLFIKDSDLIKSANELKIRTLKFNHAVEEFLSELSLIMVKGAFITESASEREEFHKIHSEFIGRFNEMKINHYTEINILFKKFQERCYAFLK